MDRLAARLQLATVPLPPARSLQWEVELGDGASVERVEVALRDINLAPQIAELTVEEPGVVYLAVPPPTGPVVDRDNPDVNGYFTSLDPEAGLNQSSGKGKKYYRAASARSAGRPRTSTTTP